MNFINDFNETLTIMDLCGQLIQLWSQLHSRCSQSLGLQEKEKKKKTNSVDFVVIELKLVVVITERHLKQTP